MLSTLYRLATSFRRTHGYLPNRVYLNRWHYRALRASLADFRTDAEIERFLGMEICIGTEREQPDVAFVAQENRKVAVS